MQKSSTHNSDIKLLKSIYKHYLKSLTTSSRHIIRYFKPHPMFHSESAMVE